MYNEPKIVKSKYPIRYTITIPIMIFVMVWPRNTPPHQQTLFWVHDVSSRSLSLLDVLQALFKWHISKGTFHMAPFIKVPFTLGRFKRYFSHRTFHQGPFHFGTFQKVLFTWDISKGTFHQSSFQQGRSA